MLKPGGTVVVVDSIQENDILFGDRMLKAFPEFNHEPYYIDYTKTDLGQLFADAAGLELVEESSHWLSKVLVFKKSLASRDGGNAEAENADSEETAL